MLKEPTKIIPQAAPIFKQKMNIGAVFFF